MSTKNFFSCGLILCLFHNLVFGVTTKDLDLSLTKNLPQKSLASIDQSLKTADRSVKIRFVSLEELLTKVESWAPDLIKDFETKKMELSQDIENIRKKRDDAVKEVQTKSSITNEKGREEASSKLIKLESDVQSTEKAAQFQLQQAAQRLEIKMGERLETFATEIAKKEGFTIVYGILPGGVLRLLYAADSLMLTDEISNGLVAKYGIKVKKPVDQKKSTDLKKIGA